MKFTIITHVSHMVRQDRFYAYAPYVREMNVWLKHVDAVTLVAPVQHAAPGAIDSCYEHPAIRLSAVRHFDLLTLKGVLASLVKMPLLVFKIAAAMYQADHIHLRCPGNVGLLGCFIQIFFPRKPKTAKYAGNWDPASRQPWSYKLQRYILNNTFLTRNMGVLVYGEWPGDSKNIIPFFTASYREADKCPIDKEIDGQQWKFVFAGALVAGKGALYAIQLVEALRNQGQNVTLDLYGAGAQMEILAAYLQAQGLGQMVFLHSNQPEPVLREAYQQSHFVILPSESEGWPKAIAEGMFWGCVPLATSVSCVPFMLGHGQRGLLLKKDLAQDLQLVQNLLNDPDRFLAMGQHALEWSRQFTLDTFQASVQKLLKA